MGELKHKHKTKVLVDQEPNASRLRLYLQSFPQLYHLFDGGTKGKVCRSERDGTRERGVWSSPPNRTDLRREHNDRVHNKRHGADNRLSTSSTHDTKRHPCDGEERNHGNGGVPVTNCQGRHGELGSGLIA
eukprot:g44119.t1